ncbi:MAG TPA: BTAD domain-containing putative transcriptional regulator [Ktedonobacteraceae bacterium]|nr:BTAD domain-containing putative transcriptional regulator [Ktedonobacteraceae bacterium]
MIPVQKTLSRVAEHHLVHPREREHQAHYRAYLFGPFRLFHKNVPIGKQMRRRSKAGTLLQWFLLNPGKLGSADEFLDLFWPDVSSETALCNLHVAIHYLRHLLQPELRTRQESKFIHRRPNNFYWFDMDETWWADTADVPHLFETARKTEQFGKDVKASFYYRKVISYCSLGFLPDSTSEQWLEPYLRRYEYVYSQALQRMIHFCSQRGELEEAMEYAYQALAVDPYCEPATKAIIDVHLQQGNIPAASRTLNDFCTFFQQELGVGPSKDFHLLRDRIIEASD